MRVVPISGHNPGPFTGSGTTTYVVAGSPAVLIDAATGEPRHLDALASALTDMQLHAEGLRVLVTHGHPDHASGAGEIARRWPRARFAKMLGFGEDSDPSVSWHPLADGDWIEVASGGLTVLHTPGHAPDHLCFWHEETRTVFTGDLVIAGHSVVIPVSRGGNLPAYLASLKKVHGLNASRLLPAHGPAVADPAALISAYIAHRLDRERQVIRALSNRPETAESIAARVYGNLTGDLLMAARENVRAHLLKLEGEGAAARSGASWRLT